MSLLAVLYTVHCSIVLAYLGHILRDKPYIYSFYKTKQRLDQDAQLSKSSISCCIGSPSLYIKLTCTLHVCVYKVLILNILQCYLKRERERVSRNWQKHQENLSVAVSGSHVRTWIKAKNTNPEMWNYNFKCWSPSSLALFSALFSTCQMVRSWYSEKKSQIKAKVLLSGSAHKTT